MSGVKTVSAQPCASRTEPGLAARLAIEQPGDGTMLVIGTPESGKPIMLDASMVINR
jgi:ribosome-interacting GTPase 1